MGYQELEAPEYKSDGNEMKKPLYTGKVNARKNKNLSCTLDEHKLRMKTLQFTL